MWLCGSSANKIKKGTRFIRQRVKRAGIHMSKDIGKDDAPVSPVNLEKMVSVIEIKSWIAVATVLVILFTTVVWGVLGTMRLRENVSGVLVKSGKIINIYATDDSVLLDFSLQPEQYVESNQVVARIEQTELVDEINMMISQNAPLSEIEKKREELTSKSQIKTSDAGRVVDVYVRVGDHVTKGTKLAAISKEAQGAKALECLLYVTMEQSKHIAKGMSANVYPSSFSRKEYGAMLGTVTYVSEHPVTYQYMFDTLGSEELAREFLKGGVCYEVRLSLVASEDTMTGYRWTSSQGPNKKFGNLTLCDATIATKSLRPVDVFTFSY